MAEQEQRQPRLVKGRLAPSPTGAQHVGNARTYLIAWLMARAQGGTVVLRIEDIDSPRVKPAAAEQAIEDLRWLGLDWDEGPVVQSQRLSTYEAALCRLQEAEAVYPCTCSRLDVDCAASAPHAEHEGPVYPGTCSKRQVADADGLSRPHAWRYRVGPGAMAYEDGFRGKEQLNVAGDFVVWKSAGTPAYQLAVVVDDADQGITEAVRGDDLVPSTPRQLLLYQALELKAPRFTHVPLVVGPDGRRLAKRHGDTRLSTLCQAGVRAEALVGLLAWSCGWLERPAPIAASDLISVFRLDRIPRQPFVLTAELLRSIGYVS
jgi:glutamyl-tRNA synthetase